jgi:transcriptional regulator with XRE-family HTH domain
MEKQQAEFWKMIGMNLKSCRQGQGLTQEELGNRLGVTRNYICSLEKGKCNPTVEKMWKISQVLDVSMETIFCGTDDTVED